MDAGDRKEFAARPQPKPPLRLRPQHFSVTEIETLRRDPYAIYARRILSLMPLDPVIRARLTDHGEGAAVCDELVRLTPRSS